MQPSNSPFPILNLLDVPSSVLTVASWPIYRSLVRHMKSSGMPVPLRICDNLLWFTQSVNNKAEIGIFLEPTQSHYYPVNTGNFTLYQRPKTKSLMKSKMTLILILRFMCN